ASSAPAPSSHCAGTWHTSWRRMGDGGMHRAPSPVPTGDATGFRLYDELAEWWPLLSPPADYAEEAAFFHSVLAPEGENPDRPSMLELGSGGGNNASFL